MENNKEKDLQAQTSEYPGRKRHTYGNREDKISKEHENRIMEDSREEKLIC